MTSKRLATCTLGLAAAALIIFFTARADAGKEDDPKTPPSPGEPKAAEKLGSPQTGDPLSTAAARNEKEIAALDKFEKTTTGRATLLFRGASKMESREFGWSLQSYSN